MVLDTEITAIASSMGREDKWINIDHNIWNHQTWKSLLILGKIHWKMPGLDLASDFFYRSIIAIEEEKDFWGSINPGTSYAIIF